jgi:endonuclease III
VQTIGRVKNSAKQAGPTSRSSKTRAKHILAVLEQLYPDAVTELVHANPFELLVATVLSAQATDASVNKATPALFKQYPDAFSLAKASPEAIEPYIKTIGLYRNKAKNLHALANQLVTRHQGEVPQSLEDLKALPGVGWKTATVVLGAAFGVPGIAVDTHLIRLASRLGFSEQKAPEKISADYQKLFPKDRWVFVHHALILFGRYRCTARSPQCQGCPVFVYCLSQGGW